MCVFLACINKTYSSIRKSSSIHIISKYLWGIKIKSACFYNALEIQQSILVLFNFGNK